MQRRIKIDTHQYRQIKTLPQYTLKAIHLDRYKFQKRIGRGSFSSVWKSFDHQSKSFVAIKIVDKDIKTHQFNHEKHIEHCYSQLQNIRSLNSDHVVKYLDHFQSQDDRLIFIVMELCDGPTIETLISRRRQKKQGALSQQQSLVIIYEIGLAIKYINGHKIMHRDLKADNVIKNKGHWILCDFGLSKQIEKKNGKNKGTQVGCINYRAPEIVLKQKYGLKVDIWSIGAILFYLLTGQPFITTTEDITPHNIVNQMVNRIKIQFQQQGTQSLLAKNRVSKSMIKFLSKMLKIDQDQRYSITEVLKNCIFNDIKNQRTKSQIKTVGEETESNFRKQQEIN